MKYFLLAFGISLLTLIPFRQTTTGGKATLGGQLNMGSNSNASTLPALDLYLGKTGMDTNRATSGANNIIFPTDASGSPLAPTAGSLIIMSGEWPDATSVANAYPANCTTPCAPTFTDNNSNALTPVFTVGTCLDTGSQAQVENLDHGFYYEANIPANTTSVTEVHPAQVSNSVWDLAVYYNMATTSVVDGSSCLTNITPSNNTAPNITGTGFTITGTNDVVLVAVDDDTFIQGNAWSASPITVPAGCTLLRGNPSKASLGAARVVMQCTAGPGTFTPKITIAQTTHDTFTIYAVAFKAGAGGTAPSSGAGDFHIASQILISSSAGTYQFYPGCPVGTPAIVVTDDAGSVTALTDSNSNTYSHVNTAGSLGAGGIEEFYTLTPGTINPNTFTISATTAGAGVDILTAHCLIVTGLDTFTAGSVASVTMTQVDAHSVSGQITESTGSGNCLGTSGTLVTCTGIPAGTPTQSGDTFIGTCECGNGPMLQPSQPAGVVAEYVAPAAIANITLGDSNDYINGDYGFHFYTTAAPALINFGFTAQQNASSITCMVTAFHK